MKVIHFTINFPQAHTPAAPSHPSSAPSAAFLSKLEVWNDTTLTQLIRQTVCAETALAKPTATLHTKRRKSRRKFIALICIFIDF